MKKKYEEMKEDIRMMKSIDELNKEQGKKSKATELWLKVMKMHKKENPVFFLTSTKCLKLVLKHMPQTMFKQ